MPVTTSRGFRKPLKADGPPNIEAAVGNLADDINSKTMKFLYGPEGSLPAWAASYEGTIYHCTDTQNEFFADNTQWRPAKGTRTLSHILIPADIVLASSGTEAGATTLIDFGAITFNGSTKIAITAYIQMTFAAAPGGGGHDVIYSLWDGSTNLGRIARDVGVAAPLDWRPLKLEIQEFAPTNASHHYYIKAWNAETNGSSATVKGGNAFPAGATFLNRSFGKIVTV